MRASSTRRLGRTAGCLLLAAGLASAADAQQADRNATVSARPSSLSYASFSGDDRPKDCPPCFNCNLDDFQCHQFAACSRANGKCVCPAGFGGEDCTEPLCGSLADGKDRAPRSGPSCDCRAGWEGINCNVCLSDVACNALMPDRDGGGGVCYKDGAVVRQNYQMCDITNRNILDQLKGQKPQATLSCNGETAECTFQCKSYTRADLTEIMLRSWGVFSLG